jgi:putative methionine-R-sulfoxide reductase with GAF domain
MDAVELIGQLTANLKNCSDVKSKAQKFIWSLCKAFDASQGAFYTLIEEEKQTFAKFEVGYAYFVPESQVVKYELGEGLIGQVAQSGDVININVVPDGYIQVISGLGKATPSSLLVYPVKKSGQIVAVFEIASFHEFKEDDLLVISKATEVLAELFAN